MVKLFFIAGEHSGDVLGGRLMAALQDKAEFAGVGGPEMQVRGLQSFVPMEDLCVMGLFEVIKHYPRLRKLGYQVIEEIERTQPDVVMTIDLPDFNFRVAKLLKKRGIFKGKIIHYVAPTVWAWRPGRAKKIAEFLDGLMCLFPFEPPYFTQHGLRTEFVGHSLVESGIDQGDGEEFKRTYGITGQTLGLFFGSRKREIAAIGPVLVEVAQRIAQKTPGIHFIVPTLPQFESVLMDMLADLQADVTFVTDKSEKWDAFAACDAAVAVSGTVGLELAYAGVPHVIAYKMHPLSWLLVRLLVKTRYAHLMNILLDQAIVPEFLQGNCDPTKIELAVLNLLYNPKPQKEAFQELRGMLTDESQPPSEKAAGFVFSINPDCVPKQENG